MTEREAVLREREAYIAAIEDAHAIYPEAYEHAIQRAKDNAARLYPLPNAERPRVVLDDGSTGFAREWRVVDGHIESRRPDSAWHTLENHPCDLSVNRARIVMDLLANPTEVVEDDS